MTEELRHEIVQRRQSGLSMRAIAEELGISRGAVARALARVQAQREPLTHDGIRHHPNTILTPHAAFYSVEGFQEMCENGALEAKRISRAKPCGIPSIRICLSTHAAKSRRRGRVQRLAQPFAGHSCFGAGSVGGELNPWTKTKFFLINFCNFPFRFWSNFAQ